MASYLSNSFPLAFLVAVLICLSFASPSMQVDDATLNHVCSGTEDPSFCNDTLKSDPRTAKASDLNGLGLISIDLANTTVTITRDQVLSLLQNATETPLKIHLQDCAKDYLQVVNEVKNAGDFFKAGQFHSAEGASSDCSANAILCENRFQFVPPYPSPITKGNHDSTILCEIVSTISIFLEG